MPSKMVSAWSRSRPQKHEHSEPPSPSSIHGAGLGFAAERLAEFFAAQDAGSARFAIRTGGALSGFVCVEPKWLSGPYLHFLGVLPAHQGRGIGTSVVDWFVAEARAGQGS